MNSISTGHNGTNGLLYVMTLLGTWATENWYLIIMVVFGAVHVYIAWQRSKREKEIHEIKLSELSDIIAIEPSNKDSNSDDNGK